MPHVISRTSRMAQIGHLSGQYANKNISSSIIRVTLKTPGKQEDFILAADTSVRQFKEKLSAHFKCQMDQLVLVFMGCLLKDHDTLSQRGILDGHTIHLVIKSKQGSRSLTHSPQNMPTNKLCHRDRNTKGNISEVFQPAVMNHTSVESALFVEPDAPQGLTQDLEVGRHEYITQMLENSSAQLLLSTTDLMRQFISEHPEMQQLMQQNSEVSHILDDSEILWQTLELARNLALIQEIMQVHQPAQTLEHPLNSPSQLGLETTPGGNKALGQSYADSKNQILNSSQDPFRGNPFTVPIEGQVQEKVHSSPSYPPSSQERLDQLPVTQVIYTSSCDLSSITSSSATPNKVSHTSRGNTATNSTKGQNHICDIQQPAGVQTLPNRELTQQLQAEDKDATISLDSSGQRLEDDLQLSEEQTASSQIIGSMIKLLLNNSYLAVQMMMFMSMSQSNEQWRQQLLTFLQQTQLSDILIALANPKASQAMLQIEHGLQLLTTEAPVLLPWIAPYLWGLGCLPAPSCSYPDTVPRAWDVPNMAEPEGPECCHKSGSSL
ncbi:ubiquilin like [Phyllostomus discolor]|uniref:Ubiquilin like n=1 Tax=Phyllostomus discolor TaxID=89673 RepID=A0A6J2LSM0_9CHIR|nr:ubiquilin-like protein [Phyllostomus discolor]KAF6106942.1 ubiquilin like [Phyllostomus discolor]